MSTIIVVGTWEGDLQPIIKAILPYSRDITLRVSFKKLIIKEKTLGYYKCVPPGGEVEIPRFDPVAIDEEWVDPDEVFEEINILTSES